MLLDELLEALSELAHVLGEDLRLVGEGHLAEVDDVGPDSAEVREGLHELLSGDVLVLEEQEDLDGEADDVVLDLSGLLLALVGGDDLLEDLEAADTTGAELLLDEALAST